MDITIENLSFSYSNEKEKRILNNLSFSYQTPDILCILGTNGTGKSTLLKCMTGKYKPNLGEVFLEHQPLKHYSSKALARKFAYIPQNHTPTFPFRVLDVVTMGRTSTIGYFSSPSKKEEEIAMHYLEFLSISHLKDKPYTNLSGGERQLVLLASALTQEPELLILDEPTAHLDFGKQYQFLTLVKKLQAKGMGVIMTTHFPDHPLFLNSKTLILQGGRISYYGQANDVITAETMSELYHIKTQIIQVGAQTICVPKNTKENETL